MNQGILLVRVDHFLVSALDQFLVTVYTQWK